MSDELTPNTFTLLKPMKVKAFITKILTISNKKAEELVNSGRITINNKPADYNSFVSPNDVVMLDGNPIGKAPELHYFKWYKPKGIESTLDPAVSNNITSVLKFPERLFPVGRLDKESEGLMLLTNDGRIFNKILKSENEHEKEYLVTVNLKVSDDFVKAVETGIVIMGKKTKPAKIKVFPGSPKTFSIILTEGMNRQIRRMCHKFNYRVEKLRRIRIMNLRINEMKPGDLVGLSDKEKTELFTMISPSKP